MRALTDKSNVTVNHQRYSFTITKDDPKCKNCLDPKSAHVSVSLDGETKTVCRGKRKKCTCTKFVPIPLSTERQTTLNEVLGNLGGQ